MATDPNSLPKQQPSPIACLEQARRRREARVARVRAARAAEEQARALEDAVRSGRLARADLFNMVRLGIVTDRSAALPCQDPHRRHNALDWERLLGTEQERPAPSQVSCPLLARAATSHAPACVEALQQQSELLCWQPGQGFVRRLPDPADPIVRHAVRPCVLLGRELFRRFL